MKIHKLHKWALSPAEARAIQKNLYAWISTREQCLDPTIVARIEFDQTYKAQEACHARVSIKHLKSLELLEQESCVKPHSFPRTPGLISFQEAPAAIAALEKLAYTPDLIICDGRGITGLDSFGVASHIGILSNIPTIGVRAPRARIDSSRLGKQRGNWLPVAGSPHGASVLLRILDDLDPVLISPGHKINLANAIQHVLSFYPATLSAREYSDLLYPEAKQAKEAQVQPALKIAT